MVISGETITKLPFGISTQLSSTIVKGLDFVDELEKLRMFASTLLSESNTCTVDYY